MIWALVLGWVFAITFLVLGFLSRVENASLELANQRLHVMLKGSAEHLDDVLKSLDVERLERRTGLEKIEDLTASRKEDQDKIKAMTVQLAASRTQVDDLEKQVAEHQGHTQDWAYRARSPRNALEILQELVAIHEEEPVDA